MKNERIAPFTIAGTIGLAAGTGYYELLNDNYLAAAVAFAIALPLAVYSVYDFVYKNKIFPAFPQ